MNALSRVSTTISATLNASHPHPDEAVSLKVPVSVLYGALDSGLRKGSFLSRHGPVKRSRRVNVEAAEGGTSDSIFFAPETPSVDHCEEGCRATPTEFVKVNPEHHDDIVYLGDDYEISFMGMSVTPQDMFGTNELLLCSFTREENVDTFVKSDHRVAEADAPTATSLTSTLSGEGSGEVVVEMEGGLQTRGRKSNVVRNRPRSPTSSQMEERREAKEALEHLPSTLRINPLDVPFIHYDPIVDGHDVGNMPDTFVPIPGTKSLYKQRSASNETGMDKFPAVFLRFTVMEIDKLSDEQLSAVKSIEKIAGSVGKAAASIPYLKIVSWMLKCANCLGRSALKKVSTPDHVMSQDVRFQIASRDEPAEDGVIGNATHESYGNYLRYGYYYFLNNKVDAKLYVQTGASSQTVPLMMRRYKYDAKNAHVNEKEYFNLTGVSYVAIKVTRGCTPIHGDREEQVVRHRERLAKLLAKYKSEEELEAEKK